ncbi:competence protein CoiA-like protein [Rhizobium sp. PP-F2F-G36]|nr:competence protein CoiA-like protein [Rhizobium sp. PP-F2F-G36]
MLTATHDGLRVDAATSERGPVYLCPKCAREVMLKKGRIVVHHFAHKPPTDCTWASGETQAHLASKIALRDAYRRRGYQANYEVEVLSSGGDRRADVVVTAPNQRDRFAIEIQHQPILFDAIEHRTQAYIAAGIPIMWIGILTDKMRESADTTAGGLIIRKYTIRPWEKWAQAFCFKELWYIDPFTQTLWKGVFSDHLINVESTSWYSEGGEEQSGGGYTKRSKRWRTLHLHGPHSLDTVNVMLKSRTGWASKVFNLPGGRFAVFAAS